MEHFKLLALIMFFTFVPNINAQDLVIEMTNQQKEYYNLSTLPKISFSEQELIITSDKLEIRYNRSQIQKYYFDLGSTQIEVPHQVASFEQHGDDIFLRNLDKKSKVFVYNASGNLIFSKRANAELKISLKGQRPGIYIIKTNNKTYKISKQ